MKTYVNPMLQVVGINKKDIIATSAPGFSTNNYNGETILAPGERGIFDPYDAGY